MGGRGEAVRGCWCGLEGMSSRLCCKDGVGGRRRRTRGTNRKRESDSMLEGVARSHSQRNAQPRSGAPAEQERRFERGVCDYPVCVIRM